MFLRIVALLMDFVSDGELDIELEIWSGHIGWGAGMWNSLGPEGFSILINRRSTATVHHHRCCVF
jgi:hypothetical protein